ncbi:VOC family protein [Mycetocola zhadangensis]|uniref:VOC family protein n=1 Tax=Mycetocola zhadangensis TaxID=1164595 RepID=UPI003A4E5A7A
MATEWTLTVDCADPARVAAFWKRALGYRDREVPDGFASEEDWLASFGVPKEEWNDGAYIEDPEGQRPQMSFLKVPEGKVVKNRLHIDIHAGGSRGESWDARWPRVLATVDDLIEAGATLIRQFDVEGQPDHVVMVDPEGNEFCVL